MKTLIHKILYRTLPLEGYLRAVSRLFFLWQRLGIGRYAPATEYVYHLPLLYMGVFSCGIGYTLQILAQKDSNPTVVTILLSLESVFAVIAGAIVLHQSMSAREYIGCVLMFIAVLLAQIPMPAKKRAAQ